jgi:DNA-directed RNA polymerase subunit RPC12/RpoP
MKCPECKSEHIRKNGMRRGKQNQICVSCDRQFVENPKNHRGYRCLYSNGEILVGKVTLVRPELIEAIISSEDLNRFFLLSDRELTILKQLRAEHNRLGFALQLCCLRYLGFFPEELQLPKPVVNYVAQQLQLIPELLVFYGKRSSTQREHQRKIQALLGYRRASKSG